MVLWPVVLQATGALIAQQCAPRTSSSRYVVSVATAVVLACVVLVVIVCHQDVERRVRSWFRAGIAPWIATAAIASTLLGAEREGVHRWLAAGPVSLHVSSVLSPWIIAMVFDAVSVRGWRWSSVALCVGLQCVHLAQPDLAQSIAVSLAVCVLAAAVNGPTVVRALLVSAMLSLSVLTSVRRDPLGAVAEVELILRHASSLAPWWLVAAISLIALWIALIARGPQRASTLSLALAAYATSVVAVGAITERFPVAYVGAGAGHVIGAYVLQFALWSRTKRASSE